MATWAVLSILRLPPLDGPPPAREGTGLLDVLSVGAVALYVVAAWRSMLFYRYRGGGLLLSIAAALMLLAEAMIAVLVGRNWHASWWEWHLLLLAAFAIIALGARREYRRGGSLVGGVRRPLPRGHAVARRSLVRDRGLVGRRGGCPRRIGRSRPGRPAP